MKKIFGIILLFVSFIAKSQTQRTDVVVLPNTSAISSYQGGSKMIFVTDSVLSGWFYLYQGPLATNGTSIVSGANSSKWRRAGFWFDKTDSTARYDLAGTLKWNYTIPLYGDGISIVAGTGSDTIRITPGNKGDITVSSLGVWNINNNSVTLGKLPTIATNSFLGRISAGTGAIEVLTATQATSMLDVFTSSLKGLVPASGGGTTNFLRADGTWAAPAGGGGGMAIGGAITSATAGSILYAGTGGVLRQSNSTLFYDSTNKRVGIGTATPGFDLHIYNASSAVGLTLESAGGGGFMQLRFRNGFGGDHWDITNYGNTNSNILAFINTGSEKVLFAPTYIEFKNPVRYSVLTSSAATLAFASNSASTYVFTGTTTTWTLPTVANNTGREIIIKNRGTGNITLNSNAGGNDIYNTSAANTISITPGSSLVLVNDGTYYLVIN